MCQTLVLCVTVITALPIPFIFNLIYFLLPVNAFLLQQQLFIVTIVVIVINRDYEVALFLTWYSPAKRHCDNSSNHYSLDCKQLLPLQGLDSWELVEERTNKLLLFTLNFRFLFCKTFLFLSDWKLSMLYFYFLLLCFSLLLWLYFQKSVCF